ncbi:glycosyltransferase family 4 protein [Geomonas oryzae]|uniref:glycosyltransferase family 4 protein n=1 Tax=Geomonas oryzae TaxID=2364273 RepID=UPI00100BA005|nr:glycosyltransferase family 4 protein [Geomonas oryzae]
MAQVHQPRNILVISHVLPHPPSAGNEIRILKMLNWLKAAGFSIVLLLNHSQVPDSQRRELERMFHKVHFIGDEYGELAPPPHAGVGSAMSSVISRVLGNSSLHERLFGQNRAQKIKSDGVKKYLAADRLIQITRFMCEKYKPCAVLGEYIFTAPCLDVVPYGVLKIIDTHDMFSRKKEQVIAYGIDDPLPCSRREERAYLLKADLVLAIQSNEARLFRELVMERDVITVGIDFDVVQKVDNGAITPGTILAVGSDNPLNQHGLRQFYEHAWPQIRERVPEATLRVVGKLARHLKTDDPRVELAGWVEDLNQEYRRAAVVINPTVAGTGLKIKSVEALCQGKALVATVNSVEGIDYADKPPYVVCPDWTSFADSVSRLLLTPAERIRLQDAALDYAKSSFHPDNVYAELRQKLQPLLEVALASTDRKSNANG